MTMSVKRVRHQARSPLASGSGSIGFVDKSSKAVHLAVQSQLRTPLTCQRVPGYSAILRCSMRVSGGILHLLRPRRHNSQITTPVVESIAVEVIDLPLIAFLKPHDGAMQWDVHSWAADRADTVCVARGCETPSTLIDPVGIRSIDDSVSADATISGAQWNEDGILRMHRRVSSGGVIPPDVDASRGVSYYLNYTPSLRGEVA